LLADDLEFFPRYDASLLTRTDLPADAIKSLERLANRLDEVTMQSLNRSLSSGEDDAGAIANRYLVGAGLIPERTEAPSARTATANILRHTLTHLKLTGLALLLACTVALPLALVLTRYPRGASALLYVTGLIQTVPSLALLALLIPLVGLGEVPAVIALFLYSLLPIVRNTITGIANVDPLLQEVAMALGLNNRERLLRIELPLAAPVILAGIKTAAVISVGTATLAAFVGAGGLGEPIITGLSLNDHSLILQGALPAAALAIAVELVFEGLERVLIPRHLRSRASSAAGAA
jgi:osmoprotectant transport system permease protein